MTGFVLSPSPSSEMRNLHFELDIEQIAASVAAHLQQSATFLDLRNIPETPAKLQRGDIWNDKGTLKVFLGD